MSVLLDEFISLDRTFHELSIDADLGDEAELTRLMGEGDVLRWPNLLNQHRVILLSEAGSGKTEEIRNAARTLRQEGKPAFFVRIEYVSQSFEDAFEEGSFEEFNAWATSGSEGWLFLDSVDEARLRDPKDFERAIRKLGRLLASVLQQAHIVITGRTTAWRAKTDLLLCRATLPYQQIEKALDEMASADATQNVTTQKVDQSDSFKVVALDDLHGSQIDAFLLGKKVNAPAAFRQAVERKEAWSLTTRPQDLAELVEFWGEHKRIGSRLELMQSSIARRLGERDQNRAEARPIAADKLRFGAHLVAAVTTLSQESAIRIPDGADNARGIAIQDVLTDWDDIDCATLLSRPIFDAGIYSTVRFHHRSVREYLTAEWLHTLIVDEASRARIESLFFRSQYGIDVIVPTMRPVLPWLVLLDERILARVIRLAPEVVFEGGDPSQLPRETRINILRQACEQLAQPAHGRSLTDYSAVQRFANVDLTDEIKSLLAQYGEDEDIAWFLLRMVEQGEIVGVVDDAKHFALHSRAKYTRIAAFRALQAVGSAAGQKEVQEAFLGESEELNRDWLAELIPSLAPNDESVTWLLAALKRVPAKHQFEVDYLVRAMSQLVVVWPLSLLPKLITGLQLLLVTPPVIERRSRELSMRYGWLLQAATQSVIRLVEAMDQSALESSALSILCKLPRAEAYGEYELRDVKGHLAKRVAEWPALNHALFWQAVAEARAYYLDVENKERLTDYWRVGVYGHLWTFNASSFESVCEDITSQGLLDDKLIALTLAFAIYREAGRPSKWRVQLKRLTRDEPELESRLNYLFHPPATGRQAWKRQEAQWKKQAARRQAAREASERGWKEYLANNIEELRNPEPPGTITNAQCYLHERMRAKSNDSNSWTDGKWAVLGSEFGDEIARAFRDGAVRFWRCHSPQLLSEGAAANSTPFSVIFGQTGLSIETRETPDWPKNISRADVGTAVRYSLHELNGFPAWLPNLYAVFPQNVIDFVIAEIDYELAVKDSDSASHYVLYDASWAGDWMWDRLAPLVVTRLRNPPKNATNLRYMLQIVQGSSLDDEIVAKLAAQKAKATKDAIAAPMWFAMWVGVKPSVAISALAARLAEMQGEECKSQFAMRFITALIGGRREGRSARQAFRTVEHMKALYLLMHEYVREKDDIDRFGKGVYSPGLRDDAQDARNALFSFIRETPGKEAFLALMEISRLHPTETARPWMAFHAKGKATLDADLQAWSPRQVRDFHNELERTPANHRDLWYLAVERLLDLKNDLEEGDASIASILQPIERETEIRKYIGNWCRERSGGRYTIPQEEELADAKRPDLRFHGMGFDGPVPVELKLADKWTGPHLFERLEIQLCGDYLRDKRSTRGVFALIYHGIKKEWDLPSGKRVGSFNALIDALQNHWVILSQQFPGVEEIRVIGIDLTKRGIDAKTESKKKSAKKKITGEKVATLEADVPKSTAPKRKHAG